MRRLALPLLLLALLFPACALCQSPLDGLYISEVLTSNAIFENGESYDFIELHNQSGKRLTLSGVTVAASKKKSYTFPAGARIDSGAYMLIWCTDEVGKAKSGVVYAGFALAAQQSIITLTDKDGVEIDSLLLGKQYGNISYGRAGKDGAPAYLASPTPGKRNTAGYPGVLSPAEIVTPPGFYEGAVTVEIAREPGRVARYTLDGGEPTAQSAVYQAPLTFTQTTVLRVRVFSEDDSLLPSSTVSGTFFIDDAPITPIVSLVTDEKYLFSNQTGVMVKGSGSTPNYQKDWEYPVNVEYFTQEGALEFSQMASFRITGQVSRKYSQKGMTLTARKAYGDERFVFSQSPFPNREFTAYRSLFLRSAGTDGTITRFKDAMLSGMAKGTAALYQDYQIIQVYINGQYWGHYNLREKINEYFIAQHYEIDDEDDIEKIQILESLGRSGAGSEDYQALIAFVKRNDLNKPENLDYVLARMDVDSYFDHAILEMICGNGDINNTRLFRVPGGKWTWILYDLDNAMKNVGNEPIFFFCKKPTEKADKGFEHAPFMALMAVPEMRDKFLTRMGELMAQKFGDTLLALIDEWEAAMTPVMLRQSARWTLLSFSDWQQNVQRLRYYATVRPEYTIEDVTQLLRLSDAEVQKYFGAYVAPEGVRKLPN